MLAKILSINLPKNKRTICISDIHGELYLFQELLKKVSFSDDDTLIILGDLFLKGKYPIETLEYIMQLSQKPNVYVLQGNCDVPSYAPAYGVHLTQAQEDWLMELTQIIETDDITFVHAGLKSKDLQANLAYDCIKYDYFVENAPKFDKWVVVGHMPVCNYGDKYEQHNPIIFHDKKIIAIDGGCPISKPGQLNAFIIQNGEFSWEYVDNFDEIIAETDQKESTDSINITWYNRHIELLEKGEFFDKIRHISSGKILEIPAGAAWLDYENHLSISSMATDYKPKISKGEKISLVRDFYDRSYVKINGRAGWLFKNLR